ncbi:MAG: hypothetical protein ABIA62_02790 [Candidatus Woesearchaeota archaeon]
MIGNKTMRDCRTARIVILIVMMLVFIVSPAYAIGVAPSKKVIEFNSGQVISYDLDIKNNGHEELEVLVYSKGEFTDNIKIGQQVFKFSSTDESRTVPIEFTMPDSLDVAGQHVIDIVAVGSTPTLPGQGAVVKADLAVISKLIIEVPYPSKYAEAKVNVLDTAVGKPVSIAIPVFNKGKEKIMKASVDVRIYTFGGEELEKIQSESVSIDVQEDFKFSVTSTKSYDAGVYYVVVHLNYDGKQIRMEVPLTIGELEIAIKSLVVDEFTLGDVAKFDILLQNMWSTELKNVHAEMQITDSDGKEQTKFNTVAVDIPSQELRALEGYWYTKDVMPGPYTATITLFYANKVSQKIFALDVYPNRIVAREAGLLTGKAISPTEELDIQNNNYLVVLVIILIGVVIFMGYRIKKKPAAPVNYQDAVDDTDSRPGTGSAHTDTKSAPMDKISDRPEVKGREVKKDG